MRSFHGLNNPHFHMDTPRCMCMHPNEILCKWCTFSNSKMFHCLFLPQCSTLQLHLFAHTDNIHLVKCENFVSYKSFLCVNGGYAE